MNPSFPSSKAYPNFSMQTTGRLPIKSSGTSCVLKRVSLLGNQKTGRMSTGSVRPSYPHGLCFTDRQRFLVFVKILFKYLEAAHLDSMLTRSKNAVSQCIRRHEHGVAALTLAEAVQRELQQCVGPKHWRTAVVYYQAFSTKQGLF